jgi:hypothetical protein
LFSQTAAPEIDFGVNTNDPANALFTTANFPGAAAADLNRARGIYSVLTGRVISIAANAHSVCTTTQAVAPTPWQLVFRSTFSWSIQACKAAPALRATAVIAATTAWCSN